MRTETWWKKAQYPPIFLIDNVSHVPKYSVTWSNKSGKKKQGNGKYPSLASDRSVRTKCSKSSEQEKEKVNAHSHAHSLSLSHTHTHTHIHTLSLIFRFFFKPGKEWKRMVTKVTFVGDGFTRKPPKYERFIRPMALRFKKGTFSLSLSFSSLLLWLLLVLSFSLILGYNM
jgi:ribosomal protein S8E